MKNTTAPDMATPAYYYYYYYNQLPVFIGLWPSVMRVMLKNTYIVGFSMWLSLSEFSCHNHCID